MNTKDLFAPQVAEERLHQNFVNIKNHWTEAEFLVLDNWLNGFEDRDNKFIKEFQTTFNSSFWELYIFNCLKRFNLDIDFSHSSPDFVAQNPTVNFQSIFECTISSHAQNQEPEWAFKFSKEQIEKPMEEMIWRATLRVCNSITSKYKKYMESYKDLPHVKEKPFFICLGLYDQPYFFSVPTIIMDRVLYAADIPDYIDFPEENERIILDYRNFDKIQKENGAEIELGFFTKNLMPEVSGIIFSNLATVSKIRALSNNTENGMIFTTVRYNKEGLQPFLETKQKHEYFEDLTDGLNIFHNPFARYPAVNYFLNFPYISNHFLNPNLQGNLPENTTPDRFLISRILQVQHYK